MGAAELPYDGDRGVRGVGEPPEEDGGGGGLGGAHLGALSVRVL